MHCNNHRDGLYIIYFEKYRQMVWFSRVSRVRWVSRVSRVRIRVSVRIRVRFCFIGAHLYIAMAPPKLHSSQMLTAERPYTYQPPFLHVKIVPIS